MLHDYQLTAYMIGAWNNAVDIAYFCIPTDGKLKSIAWQSATTMSNGLVVTIHKNNVTTGVTFPVPAIADVDTDQARAVLPMLDQVDVKKGDLITLVSDGGADADDEVNFHLTVEGVPPYNIAPVYLDGREAGTSSPSYPGPAWKRGYLTGVFWSLQEAQTSGTATLTVRKNGVSTGQTFTIPVGTPGDASTGKGFQEFPSNIDALFFEEGDVIDITSDLGGADGLYQATAILRAVGDHREFVVIAYEAALGTAGNIVVVVPRRGRLKRIFFAANTSHTGSSGLTIEREGVVIAVAQEIGALTAPAVGGGDRLPAFEGLPNTGLEFGAGDSMNIITDGDGGAGEGFYHAVFEELAENLPI